MYLEDGYVVPLERIYQSVMEDAPSARKAMAASLGIRRATKQHGLTWPAQVLLLEELDPWAQAVKRHCHEELVEYTKKAEVKWKEGE